MPRRPLCILRSKKIDDKCRNNDSNRKNYVSNNVNVSSFKVNVCEFPCVGMVRIFFDLFVRTYWAKLIMFNQRKIFIYTSSSILDILIARIFLSFIFVFVSFLVFTATFFIMTMLVFMLMLMEIFMMFMMMSIMMFIMFMLYMLV